ncbi:uncharacterized protein HMPREF1541_07735 [Cyphellophora europaea CBS 101466]|uniref:Galactose oxidase-like Early set domain-containing protein n=1 Tax=Cyphellophora europaea (strain CBS 101466) TaxID=1220924 RepID=W2RNL0_CYPE1|nr:uncharacterized protein HMPREF1541_07735 [Cyphellophora europaea CBS 101466]ETN38111.1 hypothetical protein HMPREF1541_07735 [Cyphellophora europaea CBS 101466]
MMYLLCILFFSLRLAAGDQTIALAGNTGVPAMHAALLLDGSVMFLDKIENRSKLFLPNGGKAYSSIYDPESRSVTGLGVTTNPFCCGGSFLADGRLISLGGNGPLYHDDSSVGDGFDGIRYLVAYGDQTKWSEPGNKLASKRYLTGLDQYNPVNNNPTYEILDRHGISSGDNIDMEILINNQPYFMYPFVHLLRDGTIFVFVSKSSQTFDVAMNKVVKEMPTLPGMYRTYPNTGGSVMLALSSSRKWEPEIMICGGGAFQAQDSPCDHTCGRIKPLGDAQWTITEMPQPRGMVEGINLLDGTILWLNGAQVGAQGFGIADSPAYDLLIYKPEADEWMVAATSNIPRLYHSVALMLLDGRILIARSNPNEMPVWQDETDPDDLFRKYPTEMRIEIFTPPYLQGERAKLRPTDVELSARYVSPGDTFSVEFSLPKKMEVESVEVALYQGGFVTHALHMGQQLYILETAWESKDRKIIAKARVPEIKMAPGPYFVYALANGVPSIGKALSLRRN